MWCSRKNNLTIFDNLANKCGREIYQGSTKCICRDKYLIAVLCSFNERAIWDKGLLILN